MRVYYQILFICCIGIVAAVPVVQISVLSSIKTEVQRGQIKDFLGCEEKKKILIEEDCKTEGDSKDKICGDYKKQLKKLTCKDKCKQFYKKYNEMRIDRATEQKKFYESNKDKKNMADAKEEIQDLKSNEEAFIELSCAGDVNEIGEQVSGALEKEK